jgi:hypothetical protein
VVPSDRTHRQPHITSTPVLICTHRASHTSYINTRAHLIAHTDSHTSYINTRAHLHTQSQPHIIHQHPCSSAHTEPATHHTSTPVLICTHRASHTSYINTRAHLHTASHTSYINTRAYLHTEPATHHTSTPVLICWGDAHHGQTCGGGGEGYPWLPHRTPPRAKRGNSPPQVWYCAHFRTCVAQRADPRTRSFRQKAKARTTSPSTPCFQRRAQLT